MTKSDFEGHSSCSRSFSRSTTVRLDLAQPIDKALIEIVSICRKVGMAVAIRANANNITWTVRAAVGQTINVMALNVERAIRPLKRTLAIAVLANSRCPCQYIVSNVATARKNSARRWYAFRRGRCRFKSHSTELVDASYSVWQYWLQLIDIQRHFANRAKFKDDGLAHLVPTIRGGLIVMAFVDHLTVIAQATWNRSEKVDRLACLPGVDDGAVPRLHLHRSDLALTKVLENAVGSPSISVSVLATFVATNKENYRAISGRNYTASLLAIINAVNVCGAIVNLTDYKRHTLSPSFADTLMDCAAFHRVKRVAA